MRFWYLSHLCKCFSQTEARSKYYGLGLHLSPYFVYGSSRGSGEPAYFPRLDNVISTKILCTDSYSDGL